MESAGAVGSLFHVLAGGASGGAGGAGGASGGAGGASGGAGGASGGAGTAAGSSVATLPPSHPKFALTTSLRFQEAILSNDSDNLIAFAGNPHITNEQGLNGLMLAADKGLDKSLLWCIENGIGRVGVDKPKRKDEDTALMMACGPGKAGTGKTKRDSCVALLLFAGANPMLQNAMGDTALHIAIQSRSKEILDLFYAFPPALRAYLFSIKNKVGLTPIEKARQIGFFLDYELKTSERPDATLLPPEALKSYTQTN